MPNASLPDATQAQARSTSMDIVAIVMLSSIALWFLQQFDRQE
jgi:hypothetical protein